MTGLPLQTQESRLQFYQGWIGTVVSRCFPHPTLSLASEQTLKDPRGTNVDVRRVDLANWVFRISPKFTTGVFGRDQIYIYIYIYILRFPDLSSVQKPWWNWYLTPVVHFGQVRRAHSYHIHVGVTGIFSDLLMFVQILKREWGAGSNGKLPYLFNLW